MKESKHVWMDRVIYHADGRKEVSRQWVPETWCKHDDGACHKEDPCPKCPFYSNAQRTSDELR